MSRLLLLLSFGQLKIAPYCYPPKVRDNPDSVTIIFELSFIDNDGSPISSEWHQERFVDGNFFGYTLSSDDVFRSRRVELLSNDTLSLRCRMWEVKKDIT
ncbi:hypothetical protein TNIN_212491 [Trichonephila inaurata madagascariensis]|uniref:Uncharacterized protein n=1 Tax=Trichonephila inaurata madagascariensis TaxID=2747483 RepID=A0A8X6Y7Z3_9ARAC|nr:hypothetical protein TNIN_212491 [Trichonephila inaurata madagascariensis]